MQTLRWPLFIALALMLAPVAALAGASTYLQQIDVDAIPMYRVPALDAETPSISDDGQIVVFETRQGLVPGDINEDSDVYIYDHQTGALKFLGIENLDGDAAYATENGQISGNGRYAIFISASPDLVTDDTNGAQDIFLYDRLTESTSRVNLTADGNEADSSASSPRISHDGRFIIFVTSAALVPEDGDEESDIYLVDRELGEIRRIGTEISEMRSLILSADGSTLAFDSFAADLVDGDTNEASDVFVLDVASGTITRVSVSSAGAQGEDRSTSPSLSADGRYVVFESVAPNLALDGSTSRHIYVHDRETGVTEPVDISTSGEPANDLSTIAPTPFPPSGPVVSADGRYVVFSSWGSNLVPDDLNDHTDVFMRDRETQTTVTVSRSVPGTVGDSFSINPTMSADGRYVAFVSESDNLTYFGEDDGIAQGYGDTYIYVRDMQTPYPPSPFDVTHSRTDLPVAQGQAQRTWTWGPGPITDVLYEPYGRQEDSNIVPFEHRAVQYYDKARMEITTPTDDPGSIWYVTNGLLVVEMMTGELQVSDTNRMQLAPAWINVAGDANDPDGPTYATLAGLQDAPAHPAGQSIITRVNRDGEVINDSSLASFDVDVALIDDVTGHAIAAPFWEFMNSSGTVWNGSAFVQDQLFENAYFATGRPVIEAYWAEVLVGGQARDVLMQCFERRCLTYTPGNPEGFVVEAGNVGLHYYNWRYNLQSLTPDITGKVVATDGTYLNVIDADGAVEVFQAPEGLKIGAPAWSPDGTQIAILLGQSFSLISSSADIYVMNADGSNVRQITFDQQSDAVSWSPSGDRLVFGAGGMVTIINVDGTGRTEIGPGIKPAWSPVDENRLAFIQPGNSELLMTMDLSRGSIQEVTSPPSGGRASFLIFRGYSWSPEGTQFVYSGIFDRTAVAVNEYRTLIVNADGTDSHHIETGGSEGYNPGWSPDGSQLTYAREHVAYRVNLDGSEVRGLLWNFDELVVDYDWIGSN